MEVVRLLSLDERVSLALMFHEISELHELCQPSVEIALKDSSKVLHINALLNECKIPTLSTELSEDERIALTTGVRPEVRKPRIRLNYNGVLPRDQGMRLEDLFNLGKIVQLSEKTSRPLRTIQLTVDPELGHELQAIQEKWLESRICILMDCLEGLFWVTPDTLQTNSRSQNYVMYSSYQQPAPRHPTYREYSSPEAKSLDGDSTGATWRDVLDDLVSRHPELDFVELILTHFLQPVHLQVLHESQLNGRVLLMTYQDTTYRVVGITGRGTLLLTTKLDQSLIYDTTIPFKDVVETATWKLAENQ